jgi:hypothetical protein
VSIQHEELLSALCEVLEANEGLSEAERDERFIQLCEALGVENDPEEELA